jgi:colanic acid biosynthesis glycosyl transferase WcaI
MNILFIAQCYAPESVSAAVLITELATDLVRRGHQVTFVTGAPSYPAGRVFPGYRNRIFQVERLDGVRVIRTWSYISPQKSFWPRILHYGTFSLTALYGGLLAGKPDVIISYSPPLPLGISAWLLSRLTRVPWVLQLEDLYPDAAVAAGMLRSPRAIRFFARLERFLYRKADHISLICESFRANLLQKGVPAQKISLIPVWADPDVVRPLPKENHFRSQHQLNGNFVVLYAGNFGLTSCLEDIVSSADALKDHPEITFVLVGDGVKKEELEKRARNLRLRNILFLPYQPREIFPEMLSAADIALVTLNSQSALFSLPSKIFNHMASARPILAVAPQDSEISSLVNQAGCGMVAPVGKPLQIAQTIQGLQQNPSRLDIMGYNGRRFLETRYARSQCVSQYEKMLRQVQRKKSLPFQGDIQ